MKGTPWLKILSKSEKIPGVWFEQDFVDALNFYWQPQEHEKPAYDFVHLPWKKRLGMQGLIEFRTRVRNNRLIMAHHPATSHACGAGGGGTIFILSGGPVLWKGRGGGGGGGPERRILEVFGY